MAATNAAAFASPSVPETPADPAVRSRLSAALLLCRFWTVAAALLTLGSLPGSSLFTVHDIRIEGAHQLSAAAVLARSGLAVGEPVAALNRAEVARRVAGHPQVSAADVVVAGTQVTIRITERRPAAAIPVGGKYAIVDASGTVVAERPDPGSLPVVAVDASDLPWMRVGTAVPSSVPQAIDALSLLPASLPRAGLILRRSMAGEISIVTSDRIVARLGGIAGLRERAAGLAEILATVRSQGLILDYIDLRFAGNVILKPTAGAGAGAGVRP